MKMRKTLYALAALAVMVLAGCEDTPSDPANQPIVAEWKASRIGEAFSPATELELHFDADGTMHGTMGSANITGAYSTTGASGSSTVRNITLTATAPFAMNMVGIYEITGNQMKLEVVPNDATDNITPPEAILGIGSTKEGASSAGNKYVTELQKQ